MKPGCNILQDSPPKASFQETLWVRKGGHRKARGRPQKASGCYLSEILIRIQMGARHYRGLTELQVNS